MGTDTDRRKFRAGKLRRRVRLYHFSDDPAIARFEPRPVRIPAARAPGREWLNGPLVWAIDEAHQALYLFPRDCPRILVWATEATSDADRQQIGGAAMVAFIEPDTTQVLAQAEIWRYDLPSESFEALDDAGMWVSHAAVSPRAVDRIAPLDQALSQAGVEVRISSNLSAHKALWATTLHVSGIRLRNARSW